MRDLSRKPFKARRLADEPRPDDVRSEYGRDEARIVHGAGFRRLQGKTQVPAQGVAGAAEPVVEPRERLDDLHLRLRRREGRLHHVLLRLELLDARGELALVAHQLVRLRRDRRERALQDLVLRQCILLVDEGGPREVVATLHDRIAGIDAGLPDLRLDGGELALQGVLLRDLAQIYLGITGGPNGGLEPASMGSVPYKKIPLVKRLTFNVTLAVCPMDNPDFEQRPSR